MRDVNSDTIHLLDIIQDEPRRIAVSYIITLYQAQAFYNVLLCAHSSFLSVKQLDDYDIQLKRL
jgi:hypothetical protein